jgi:hypothetical protein
LQKQRCHHHGAGGRGAGQASLSPQYHFLQKLRIVNKKICHTLIPEIKIIYLKKIILLSGTLEGDQ